MSWQRQTLDEPLFPDILWSRPENKRLAGKLLIIGGQAQEFAHVAGAYQAAQAAGAGTIKTILPRSLEKLAGALPNVEFAPANKSGSFASTALAELLDYAGWADAVLLAGDLGKNSETTTTLDKFLTKNQKPVTIISSALESIGLNHRDLTDLNANLVLSFKDVQQLAVGIKNEEPITSTMNNESLASASAKISRSISANLIFDFEDQVWVASKGKVVSTKISSQNITQLGAFAAVWHMQHINKPLEALSSACYQLAKQQTE